MSAACRGWLAARVARMPPAGGVVLASLLLRILVPAGFMPASVADGWYLTLCPDGWSRQALTVLLGHQHHHAPEHHSGGVQQCELGGGLAAPCVTAAGGAEPRAPGSSPAPPLPQATPVLAVPDPAFRPRAPPRLSRFA